MIFKHKKLPGLFLLFFCLQFIYSGLSSASLEFRKYAGEFMEIGVAPRAQALGGAYTAISGDVSSAYYNPAGLWNLQQNQVSFMHTQQMLASVNYDFLAYAAPQGENRVWALSVVRLGIDNIKDSRNAYYLGQGEDPSQWRIDWDKINTFNAADYIFTVSMAQQWRQKWAIGANVKIIRRDLANYSANGIGFDLGLQHNIWSTLVLGANLRNVTSTLIAWNTGEKELVKPSLYLGATALLNIKSLHSGFRPVADAIIRAENRQQSANSSAGAFSFDFAGGLEYSYHETLFLRAGVDEISRLSAGAGVRIPHILVDYSFTSYDTELGNSHRIGLIVYF